MKIHIDDTEMKTAIIDYVAKQGISIEGKNTVVEMVAGRKENGFSATVDITNGSAKVAIKKEGSEKQVPIKDEDNAAEPKDSKKLKFGNA